VPEGGARPLEALVQPVQALREDDDLAHAAARVAAAGGGLPVADEFGRLVGYLSEGDLLRALFPGYLSELRTTRFLTSDFPSLLRHAREAARGLVGEHMTRDPASVDIDDPDSHAAALFLREGFRVLPVVDAQGRVRGVVRLRDVVESLLRACGALPGADLT
jgi:CBS domain-containing protein